MTTAHDLFRDDELFAADSRFCEQLKHAPSSLANNVVRVVDTAKLLKLGCQANGLAASDSDLLSVALELIKLEQGGAGNG